MTDARSVGQCVPCTFGWKPYPESEKVSSKDQLRVVTKIRKLGEPEKHNVLREGWAAVPEQEENRGWFRRTQIWASSGGGSDITSTVEGEREKEPGVGGGGNAGRKGRVRLSCQKVLGVFGPTPNPKNLCLQPGRA